tara:strand:+ start:5206 stop:5406 length:201 start_codon:yes stop_codon:yes gene_type:complete
MDEEKMIEIKLYRKNYYQKNKKKIAEYQRIYYLKKKGLSPVAISNWKGKRQDTIERINGSFTITFD